MNHVSRRQVHLEASFAQAGKLRSMSGKKLDFAERWLRDGIDSCRTAAFYVSVDVDMSSARSLIEFARAQSIRLTYVHILLRAAALALAANPELNRMICGKRAYRPDQVDISLSVAGESIAAPLLVIESADRKELPMIAAEVTERAQTVRDSDRDMLRLLRRWGWMLPSGFLRRAALRALMNNAGFRRKGAGVFQLSVLPEVDSAMSTVFGGTALLAVGAVKDKVVAIDGKAVVRPMTTLTCCGDHRVWSGGDGQKFLASMQGILKSTALSSELPVLTGKR